MLSILYESDITVPASEFEVPEKSVFPKDGSGLEAYGQLFPNPANEIVSFQYSGESSGLNISISALDGRMVMSILGRMKPDHCEFNVNTLPAGIYLVKVFDKDIRVLQSKLAIIR